MKILIAFYIILSTIFIPTYLTYWALVQLNAGLFQWCCFGAGIFTLVLSTVVFWKK